MPAIVEGVRSLRTGIDRPWILLKNGGDQHVSLSGAPEAQTLLNTPMPLIQRIVRCYPRPPRLAT